MSQITSATLMVRGELDSCMGIQAVTCYSSGCQPCYGPHSAKCLQTSSENPKSTPQTEAQNNVMGNPHQNSTGAAGGVGVPQSRQAGQRYGAFCVGMGSSGGEHQDSTTGGGD